MRRWVMLTAVALLAAACGGGGDADSATDEGREYVDAIMVGMDDDETPIDPDEARCAAEGWVDFYGVDGFRDADVSPENIRAAAEEDADFPSLVDFTDEQADGFVDIMIECIDFGALFARQLSAEPDGPELSAEQLDCIGSALERSDEFREGMKTEALGGDASETDLTDVTARAFDECDISMSDLLGS
jgi:hypothetical protein